MTGLVRSTCGFGQQRGRGLADRLASITGIHGCIRQRPWRRISITRSDPFYASLAFARLATFHADAGDARAYLRAIGLAQDSYDRADQAKHRPPWMGFYDQAELDSLATFANLRLGRWEAAEHHAHRCLAALHPDLERLSWAALCRRNEVSRWRRPDG